MQHQLETYLKKGFLEILTLFDFQGTIGFWLFLTKNRVGVSENLMIVCNVKLFEVHWLKEYSESRINATLFGSNFFLQKLFEIQKSFDQNSWLSYHLHKVNT